MHPQFASNRLVYLYYIKKRGDELGRALARMEATERRWKVGELSPAVAAHCTVQPFVPGVAARMLSSHFLR